MTRSELEHIIRAAAANANVSEIIVIGSQAILGTYPNAPVVLLGSMEADVFPKDDPSRSIVIDGAMGELSLFHETFGYYAHGIDESTACLPNGWRDRLVKIQNQNTGGAIGWCLDVHDLAVSKLAAGREKDFKFVQRMVHDKLASPGTILARLQDTPSFPIQAKVLATARLNEWQL